MADTDRRTQLTAWGLDPDRADTLSGQLDSLPNTLSPEARWHRISRAFLTPDIPFSIHHELYREIYAGRPREAGPGPAWIPSPAEIASSNIGQLCNRLGLPDYASLHQWSVQNRATFWDTLIRTVGFRFSEPYHAVQEGTPEHPVWLPGSRLNIAASCFTTSPDAVAVRHRQPGGPLQDTTYGELDQLSNRVANSLTNQGLASGDAIAIYMPMTPESVAIYLGIVKMGGVVVSISDSFAPEEIAARLRIANARAVFTQELTTRTDAGSPLYARLIEAQAPLTIVVACDADRCRAALRPDDRLWDTVLTASPVFTPVGRDPGDAINILFSSGTTGAPKAIPWVHTTPIKCAVDAFLHHDIQPDDTLAWPTNLGWMMGPWLIYAALVNHASIALYEGPPTGRAFGEFVRDAGVTMLGLIPSLVKTWRHTRCMEGIDWSRIRAFSSTGECSNPDDMLYLMMLAGYKPVIEYCGGTEIGGGYITGTLVQPAAPATFTTPALGLDFTLLDEQDQPTRNGEVFIQPPSIGLSQRLLNHDHHAVYFEGAPTGPDGCTLRRHGDQVEALGGGFFRHHGRTDDTMKLKGIKVSATELEHALNTVPGIRETAAVAVLPPDGGPANLVVYAVCLPDTMPDPRRLKTAMQTAVRTLHGSLCKIHDVCLVATLPRTASNKVMRRVLRDQYSADMTGATKP